MSASLIPVCTYSYIFYYVVYGETGKHDGWLKDGQCHLLIISTSVFLYFGKMYCLVSLSTTEVLSSLLIILSKFHIHRYKFSGKKPYIFHNLQFTSNNSSISECTVQIKKLFKGTATSSFLRFLCSCLFSLSLPLDHFEPINAVVLTWFSKGIVETGDGCNTINIHNQEQVINHLIHSAHAQFKPCP